MQGLCSSDGLTYFESSDSTGTSRVLDLYSVSTGGEVRHQRRTVPLEFTSVVERDFFPGDAGLVTLIEAGKRDERDPNAAPREIQYILAVSDHDGDGSKTLALDLHFKPLKVAQFGSGEFLVLGWQEANQLPQLAVLKEDGTLRRFIDLDPRKVEDAADAALLGRAALVPFGRGVLLTYPGTTRPIRVVTGSGADRITALNLPAGYVLHDVLNSGCCSTLVVRVQETAAGENAGKAEDRPPPRQRIFEFVVSTGMRLREFTFGEVPVSAVTCAAGASLTAIFERAVGDTGAATELVVGTVRR